MIIYEYEVRGAGRFPGDMLRYDCAWPTYDAFRIMEGPEDSERREDFYERSRTVKLASIKEPTVARWNSFNWGVFNITKRKV